MIPGMEMAAPERTDNSSGLSGEPNTRPVRRSISVIADRTRRMYSLRARSKRRTAR